MPKTSIINPDFEAAIQSMERQPFYHRSHLPKSTPQGEFSQFEPEYSLKITDGREELVRTGQTNVYDKIQASKNETLIYNILDRFQNGEIPNLDLKKGFYADMSKAPESLAQAQQAMIDCEKLFASLPLEIRQSYDHSISKFIVALDDGSFEKRFDKKTPVAPIGGVEPKPESTKEEPK